MEEKIIAVGDTAPDFTLKDQDGNEITLSSLRSKKVVLSWHPLAWTSVCRTQMEQLEAHRADFEAGNGVALGLSVDTVPSKKAWAEDMGIEHTRLLSDFWPHGGVARTYHIFREQNGFSERAVFIVDEAGVVRFKKIYPIKELPDIGEIITALSGV
jgi:peroxiredoxin